MPEPGTGHAPFAVYGGGRDLERRGGFVDGEAAEDEEVDDFDFARVEGFEAFERLLDGEDVGELGFGLGDAGGEGDALPVAAALAASALAGVIDEDAAHLAGGHGEEVGAVVVRSAGAEEAEIGFVDHGGGREGVAGFLRRKIMRREAAEVVVNERRQFVERGRIAGAPAGQKYSYFRLRKGVMLTQFSHRITAGDRLKVPAAGLR